MAIAPTKFPAEAVPATQSTPRPITTWQRLLRHRLFQAGSLILLALFCVYALCAFSVLTDKPLLTGIPPQATLSGGLNELGEPHPPGDSFLLGADTLGRDVWTRVLFGAFISLTVAVVAMVTATLIGTTIGLLGGYFGGWTDALLTRFTEIVLSLPTILLAIALYVVLPGESYNQRLFKLLLAISLVTWTGIARAVRGQVLSLKEREYVEAARALGASHWRILTRHLLPNVLPTVIVLATLATAHNILLEAGLSYLGLGVDPSAPSWGGMIAEGQAYILSAPWIILAAGAALVLAVTGFNLLGQALQEVLEPR
jgi:ABC-type dipeptide/oligopeptide/nickel transport system permease subunit